MVEAHRLLAGRSELAHGHRVRYQPMQEVHGLEEAEPGALLLDEGYNIFVLPLRGGHRISILERRERNVHSEKELIETCSAKMRSSRAAKSNMSPSPPKPSSSKSTSIPTPRIRELR